MQMIIWNDMTVLDFSSNPNIPQERQRNSDQDTQLTEGPSKCRCILPHFETICLTDSSTRLAYHYNKVQSGTRVVVAAVAALVAGPHEVLPKKCRCPF